MILNTRGHGARRRAGFEFQPREQVDVADLGARLCQSGLGQIEDLEPPATLRAIALVHANDFGGDECRLLTTGAGAHFEDRVALIVLIRLSFSQHQGRWATRH